MSSENSISMTDIPLMDYSVSPLCIEQIGTKQMIADYHADFVIRGQNVIKSLTTGFYGKIGFSWI